MLEMAKINLNLIKVNRLLRFLHQAAQLFRGLTLFRGPTLLMAFTIMAKEILLPTT
jgi:hypothetical protein